MSKKYSAKVKCQSKLSLTKVTIANNSLQNPFLNANALTIDIKSFCLSKKTNCNKNVENSKDLCYYFLCLIVKEKRGESDPE